MPHNSVIPRSTSRNHNFTYTKSFKDSPYHFFQMTLGNDYDVIITWKSVNLGARFLNLV